MGLIWSFLRTIFGFEIKEDTPDPVTGLSRRQKDAIVKSWKYVRLDLKGNGVAFFMKFFTLYPQYKDFFETFRGKKLEDIRYTPKLRAHGTVVMNALTTIVDNLDDTDVLLNLLRKTGRDHLPRKVGHEQFQALAVTFVTFLEERLGSSRFTQLTKEAWQQALLVVNMILEQGLNEARQERDQELEKQKQ